MLNRIVEIICGLAVLLLPCIANGQAEIAFKYRLNTKRLRIMSVDDTARYHDAYVELKSNKRLKILIVDSWQHSDSQQLKTISINDQETPAALRHIGELFKSMDGSGPTTIKVFANIQQDQSLQKFNVKLWYFGSEYSFKQIEKDSALNGKLVKPKYDVTKLNYKTLICKVFPNHTINVHFSEQQVAAISLFYRYYMGGIGPGGSFANANVAYYFIWGTTKFTTGQFIQPANKFWGIGPYIGFSSPPSTGGSKSSGGQVTDINLGADIFYSFFGFQLSAAYGFDFLSTKNIIPYFGIGVGFKLLNISGGSSSSKQGASPN